MANTLKIKRSAVATTVPSALQDGELAINQADRKLFYKDSGGTIRDVPLDWTMQTTFVLGKNTGTYAGTFLNAAAGTHRELVYQTAGLARWTADVEATAEGGGNAGSNYTINRFDDAGVYIDTPFSILRSSGEFTLKGGKFTGNIELENASGATLSIDSVPGVWANIAGRKNGLLRWEMSFGNSDAEAGSNAGSNFRLYRYNDAGSFIDTSILINRASGVINFVAPYVDFDASIYANGNPIQLDDDFKMYDTGTHHRLQFMDDGVAGGTNVACVQFDKTNEDFEWRTNNSFYKSDGYGFTYWFSADGSASNENPNLFLDRWASHLTVAADQVLGTILFQGPTTVSDSGEDYAQIVATAPVVTDGIEQGELKIRTKVAGAWNSRLYISKGLRVGTGLTDKGLGTINVDTGYYLDGGPLTEIIALTPGANQNNYNVGAQGHASVHTILKLNPTASIKITGIDTTGWEAGKTITIKNETGFTGSTGRLIILENFSSSSSSANQFNYPGPARLPLMLMPGEHATFYFGGSGTNLRYMGGSTPRTTEGIFDLLFRPGRSPSTAVSGTAAAVDHAQATTDFNSNPYPVIQLTTGTTTTGRAAVLDNSASMRAGVGCLLFVGQVNTPTLSDGTNEYDVQMGFIEAGAPTDMIAWVYDRNTSTYWCKQCRSNGTGAPTAVTAVASSTGAHLMLGIFVNGDGTSVDFFYSTNGGYAWDFDTAVTSNIPNTAARAFGCGAQIIKSAGTTARLLNVGLAGYRGTS